MKMKNSIVHIWFIVEITHKKKKDDIEQQSKNFKGVFRLFESILLMKMIFDFFWCPLAIAAMKNWLLDLIVLDPASILVSSDSRWSF